MAVKIRFECGREDRWSEEFGPFPYVQLTYETLRVGPGGEDFAALCHGDWYLLTDSGVDGSTPYSDIVIFSSE